MTLPIFLHNTFTSLKTPYLKRFFYQNCSHCNIEQDHLSKNVKNVSFRLFNKIINFITESLKKPTIYSLLFVIGIYSPKNTNKYPSEMKNQHQSSNINESYQGSFKVFSRRIFIRTKKHKKPKKYKKQTSDFH